MPLLFLIVFINLMGFGVVIPLMPFYVLHLGAGPELIILIFSFYSGAQFVTAPIWGRLSDKYGRKPILAWTMLATVLSYIILAYADSLWMLVLSRFVGGVAAGNIGITFAYMTDITTEEDRSKGMGLLGAAFGLGFIFGPAIGGILAGPDVATADYFTPAIVAAGLSLVAFIGIVVLLPESLKPELRARLAQQKPVSLLQQISTVLSRRVLVMFVAMGFFFVSAWALLESILGFWANALFNFGPTHVGYLLVWMGTISVFIQGFLIGPLTRRFGEQNLLMTAMAISLVGFVALAASTTLVTLLLSTALLSISSGLFNPIASSLVSKEATEEDRGVVLGVYQGAGSLARMAGPAFAGPVFVWIGASVPFLVAAGLMVPCWFLIQRIIQQQRLAASTPG